MAEDSEGAVKVEFCGEFGANCGLERGRENERASLA